MVLHRYRFFAFFLSNLGGVLDCRIPGHIEFLEKGKKSLAESLIVIAT